MSFLSTPIIIIDHPLLLWTTPLIGMCPRGSPPRGSPGNGEFGVGEFGDFFFKFPGEWGVQKGHILNNIWLFLSLFL